MDGATAAGGRSCCLSSSDFGEQDWKGSQKELQELSRDR